MKKTFNVKGMHCGSCEILIKEGVNELSGVKSVEASTKKGQAIVEFDEKRVAEKQIIAAIEKEGYKVEK